MSQYLDLDFIQKPIISHISVVGAFILLLTCWLAVFTWKAHHLQQVKLIEVTENLFQINQKLPKKTRVESSAKSTSAAISTKQLAQITDDFSVLATPWNELLDSIEQSDMQDVVLLGLEPSVKKQQVTLTGEAKNLTAILQYISQLERKETLSQVYLQKHSVNEASNEKPVSFSIVARWDNTKFDSTQ
jgi:biopolymer transport protein ExbB/TolQ